MATKEFGVLSSDGVSTYTIVVEWNGVDLSVACDCRAGLLGEWCRHKSDLLNGVESSLTMQDGLCDLLQWVKASPVCEAITNIRLAEDRKNEAEKMLIKAKSNVKAMKLAAAILVNSNRKNK